MVSVVPFHDPAEPATVPARTGRQRRPLVRWTLGSLVVVAAAAGAVGGQRLLAPPPSLAYMTAPAVTGDVEDTVLATGTVKPTRLVAVGAQVSGRIIRLAVAIGDRVRKGDLIAEIDSTTQRNALRTAEADLADKRAQRREKDAARTKAEATLARQRRLAARDAVAQSDLETAEADVKAVHAQIEALDAQITQAEVAVETAQANLGYTRVSAPIDGTVLALSTQEGQTVNAAQSAPTIVVLGQLDRMRIRAEISEADVVKVKPGQPIHFTILGEPDKNTVATLEEVEPAPESVTKDSSITSSSTSSASSSSSSSEAIYYGGVFTVPNPDGRLKTYMTAEVHIVIDRKTGVLTVPAAALVTATDRETAVKVVDASGRVDLRPVKVGLNNKVVAEILSGLRAGERVVVGEVDTSAATKKTQSRQGPPPPMGF